MIINLTPHTIIIAEGPDAGSYRSDGVARVETLPLGPVVGLPAPRKGRLYVVSLIVAERVPMREDLRVPSEQVRDDQGRVVAARGLSLPRDVSPALAVLFAMVAAEEEAAAS